MRSSARPTRWCPSPAATKRRPLTRNLPTPATSPSTCAPTRCGCRDGSKKIRSAAGRKPPLVKRFVRLCHGTLPGESPPDHLLALDCTSPSPRTAPPQPPNWLPHRKLPHWRRPPHVPNLTVEVAAGENRYRGEYRGLSSAHARTWESSSSARTASTSGGQPRLAAASART